MERIAFYIDRYDDEVTPCDCSLDGWAKWLSKPAEEWGRDTPAKDGQKFEATRTVITYHKIIDQELDHTPILTPALPEKFDALALPFAEGQGWLAETLADNLGDLGKTGTDFSVGDYIAALVDDGERWVITYHADGPRCEAEIAPVN